MMTKIILLIFTAGAACTDCRSRRISNAWILAGVEIGLLSNFFQGGLSALAVSLLGSVFGLALGYVLWLLHVFKAGDGKLVWMIGTILGYAAMWPCLVVSLLCSGAVALLLLLWHGIFFRRVQRLGLYLWGMLLNRKFHAYLPEENDQIRMPLAATSFLGIVIYLIMEKIG